MYPVTLGVICFFVWLVAWLIDPTFLPPGSLDGGLSVGTAPAVFTVAAIGIVLNHRLHVWLSRRSGSRPGARLVEDYWELQLVFGILSVVASLLGMGEGTGVAWGVFGVVFGIYTVVTSGVGYSRARRAASQIAPAERLKDQASVVSQTSSSSGSEGDASRTTVEPDRRRGAASRTAIAVWMLIVAGIMATLHCLPRPETVSRPGHKYEESISVDAQARVFELIDPLRKTPSVATIGGAEPEPGLKSWFGGGFHLPVGEAWPQLDGMDAIPLLQIVCSELPERPAPLAGIALIQVFFSQVEFPLELPASNGDGFLVRTYDDLDKLARRDNEPLLPRPQRFQVTWGRGQPEGPVWEDACDLIPDELTTAFVELDDCFQIYSDRYVGHDRTKVGGWPTYIQGHDDEPGAFVLQIASEEKPQWMVGDCGNLYFYVDEGGRWFMDWDCY